MFKQQYKCDKCNKVEWYKPNEVPDKCECGQFTYPMYFKSLIIGNVYKFISLELAIVLEASNVSKYVVGDSVELLCPHTDKTNWIEVPKPIKTYNDWRLPTIKELLTLVNYKKFKPACDLEDTTSSDYWSATTYADFSCSAWNVSFGKGYTDYNFKSNNYSVRCVRDGKNGLEWSKTSENTMTWEEALDYADNLVAEVYYKG